MKSVMDAAVDAYLASEDADGPGIEWHSEAVRRHLTAALAVVSEEHEQELAKLRDAYTLAGNSRELWKQRALDLGYGGAS